MRPKFRADLTCSREEQQGVVFYRVDEPKTQTSFRLYEIEYLIAQQLNGQRTLEEVIESVKSSFNFDISQSDLQRFVEQLESMGFLDQEGGESTQSKQVPTEIAAVPTSATQPMAPVDDQNAEPPSFTQEPAFFHETEAADVTAAETAAVDALGESNATQVVAAQDLELMEPEPEDESFSAEAEEQVLSALTFLRQGELARSRDYLLAARDAQPSHEGLARLLEHVEVAAENGMADLDALWETAKEAFPQASMVAEATPLAAPQAFETTSSADVAGSQDDDYRSWLRWMAVLVFVVVLGGGGITWLVTSTGVFATKPTVRVVTLKAETLPVFYPEPASKVAPLSEQWLSFGETGVLDRFKVATGDRVKEGDILLQLNLPRKQGKKLKRIRKTIADLEGKIAKTKDKLEKNRQKREELTARREEANQMLKELRPKGVLKRGGVSKRDIKKWTRIMSQANKKLSKFAKAERKPRNQLKKLEKRIAVSLKNKAQLENQLRGRLLKAPFDGEVIELKATAGEQVAAGDNRVLIRDTNHVRLSFGINGPSNRQVGGESFVSVAGGQPSKAKVIEVRADEGVVTLDVSFPDPTGQFFQKEPDEFRLVRDFAERAFRVPTEAVVQGANGSYVVIALQERALARPVEVLAQDAGSLVIQDSAGALKDGQSIVSARIGDDLGVSSIQDGAFMDVR